jgi:hypothetical protein
LTFSFSIHYQPSNVSILKANKALSIKCSALETIPAPGLSLSGDRKTQSQLERVGNTQISKTTDLQIEELTRRDLSTSGLPCMMWIHVRVSMMGTPWSYFISLHISM